MEKSYAELRREFEEAGYSAHEAIVKACRICRERTEERERKEKEHRDELYRLGLAGFKIDICYARRLRR